MRVLAVEDDPVLADGLRTGLTLTGAQVELAMTCAEARAALRGTHFDAVVLDVMLPDGSGLEILREMRSSDDPTPVLLLTALDEVSDRIRGLDSGADDYLGKPFDLNELAARTRAIARRGNGRASPHIAHGGIVLDPARRLITVNGEPVSLSRREFAVLSALMERPGVVRSKSDLEEQLYGWQEDVESNTIEVHIHHLRGKIGKTAIETVRGLGYRMGTVSP